MIKLLLMAVFFGGTFAVGYPVYKAITPVKKNWLIYLILGIAVIGFGLAISLVASVKVQMIAAFGLAITMLIMYLRLSDAFKIRNDNSEARYQAAVKSKR